MGRVKQDNNEWEIVTSLQMKMPVTLLLFHVEPKLQSPCQHLELHPVPRDKQVANENLS